MSGSTQECLVGLGPAITSDVIDSSNSGNNVGGMALNVETVSIGDNFLWVVLTDPDGNAFCVVSGH